MSHKDYPISLAIRDISRIFRGKERNQNGISWNTTVKIWKVQHRCIIFIAHRDTGCIY